MPVTVGVEWGIVKMPKTYRPWMRSFGRVWRGTVPLMDQDGQINVNYDMVIETEDQLYAMNVSEMLNREIPHEGYWMVSWCHPGVRRKEPLEMIVRWLDRDKDVQFRVWFEGPPAKVMAKPLEDIAGACEAAWQEWYETIKHRLEVSPNQMVKATLGEKIDMPDFGPDVMGM